MPPKVFISYRHNDSQKESVMVYHELAERFGKQNVFIDRKRIPLGRDIRDTIQKELKKCDVLLVVVGKNWSVDGDNANESIQLEDESDYVKFEIRSAIALKKTIIPLLIDDAPWSILQQVPGSIKELTGLNGGTLATDESFDSDIQRLIYRVNQAVGGDESNADNKGMQFILGGLFSFALPVLGGLIAIYLAYEKLSDDPKKTDDPREYRSSILVGMVLAFMSILTWVVGFGLFLLYAY